MSSNAALLKRLENLESYMKASTTSSDSLLSPEQASKFILTTVDQSDFLKRIGLIQMMRDKRKLYTLGMNSRVIRKGTSEVEPAVTGHNKGERQLDCVETILAMNIPFDLLEENIEEESFEATLTNLFTTQFANDLVDLIINGDETSLDDFESINDGILAIADSDTGAHKETFEPGTKPSEIFRLMKRSMPNKWKRNVGELLYIVSPSIEEDYRDELATRQTALGDKATTDDMLVPYKGIPVYPLAQMPDTQMLLINPKMLVLGWHKRLMRIGRWVNERKRRIEYTITAKTDQEYTISDAVVKYKQAA